MKFEYPLITRIRKYILKVFNQFETGISIILSLITGSIILISLLRIITSIYTNIILKIKSPLSIESTDFYDILGKIITLLITLEFMNTIINALRGGELKTLIKDVTLITGLTICRKLIILDYKSTDPLLIASQGFILIALALFYFLIKSNGRNSPQKENNNDTPSNGNV